MKKLRVPVGFWLVLCLSVLYAGSVARTSILRIVSLDTVGWDMTNITQTVWNTAHGEPFAMTNIFPLTNRLGAHVEPVIFSLTPLAWLAGDAPNWPLPCSLSRLWWWLPAQWPSICWAGIF